MPDRGVVISLEGDRRLVVTFREAGDAVGDYTHVNEEAAAEIIRTARHLTPVDTGYLQDSTTSSIDETSAVIYNPLDYAPVIHNGWPAHHISATPFLEGGWLLSIDEWSPLYLDRLKEIIDDIEGA